MSVLKSLFWFSVGALLGLFLVMSFVFFIFQKMYENRIYPGVFIEGVDFGGKHIEDVKAYFDKKNERVADAKFVFQTPEISATISAKQLNFGYNKELLAIQAHSLGRSRYILSDISLVFQAYLRGVTLEPSYHYSSEELETFFKPIAEKLKVEPVDALFKFEGGKVLAFRPSSDGQEVDIQELKREIEEKTLTIMYQARPQTIPLQIPIRIVKPNVTTEKANNLGIKELIGQGTSLFQGSIINRVYNITLASSRINGILVAPGEIFSFNKALGDVSAFTGYKQAYVIQDGRTILGDGGGVCQVSTTLFRALLNTGLPIVERNAHSYRVGYYEQDSPPGFDATVFAPSVDLRFKNDTGNHILIQSVIDPTYYRLTFLLYGTKDGREVTISQPVITNQSKAPEPLYQDDPNLPKNEVKQVDFAAAGATTTFTRRVSKEGKVITSDKFVSNFRPWRAVYLRGTKE